MIQLEKVLQENESRLCIGLDPRIARQDRVEFASSIIEQTHQYAIAYKPNIQFWHGTSYEHISTINQLIHDQGIPSIADLKISDIGSSNAAGLQNMADMGFDYVTHSPFPGNMQDTSELAAEIGIGIITLVVMSNPQAKWMVTSGQYLQWAEQANTYADGVVLGTTNHVTREVLEELSEILDNPFVLAPGLGSQGGQVGRLQEIFGDRVIFNVSRGINQAEDPSAAAASYYSQINQDQ